QGRPDEPSLIVHYALCIVHFGSRFMSAERPTFSPFWHRVRTLRPRLRPHVGITRQRYRGRIWHVVHDPTSNQFFRLNPVAHDFVGLLDGRRDVESAWKISLSKFGDAAPTQNEVI